MGDAMQVPTPHELRTAIELTAAYKDLAVAVGDNRQSAADADRLSRLIAEKSAESKDLHRRFADRFASGDDDVVKASDLGAALSELSGLYYRYQDAVNEYAASGKAIDICHDRVVALQDGE